MARECSPRSVCEQTKAVAQTHADLLDVEDSRSDGGELDRQWQSIQPAAQIDHGRLIRCGQLECAGRRRRPVCKQHDCLVLLQVGELLACISRWEFQRSNGHHVLT